MNIFELTEKQVLLKEIIENEIGDLTDDQLKEVMEIRDSLDDTYKEKLKGYAIIIKNFQSLENEAKLEIDRISKIKSTYQNCYKRMMNVLKCSMIDTKTDKADFATIKLYLKNNPSTLKILDEKKVPRKFEKITISIMKAEINREYKGKDNLPKWLEKVEAEKSLIIK